MVARTLDLTDHLSAFLDDQVGSGHHLVASDVVRKALRRYEDALQAEQARIAAIRKLIRDGRAAMVDGDVATITDAPDADALPGRLTRRAGPPG